MSVVQVEDNNFEEVVLNAELPVLVYFWAEWCGPCKASAPIYVEAANDYIGKVTFVKVNVDHAGNTAVKYGIRGVPTLITFKAGEAVATQPGAFTKSQLLAFIDSNV